MLHLYVIPFTKPIMGGQIAPQMKDCSHQAHCLGLDYLDDASQTYTPSADVNEFVLMSKHLMEVNSTVTSLPLAVSFKGFGFFKGQMIQQMGTVMEMQKMMGAGSDDDFDTIKAMFLETNIYLLVLTGVGPARRTES